MNEPQMLDFVKAMLNVERLRMIGVLARGRATVLDVANSLGVPMREALDHLEFLAYVGALRVQTAQKKQDDIYELNDEGLEAMSRQLFNGQREAYIPSPELDEKSRKVLAAYLNPDGSLKQLPTQPMKMKVILDYLVAAFTPGTNYTEKEVNTILRRFYLDTAELRRALIDAGLMQREGNGSRYWRPS